METKQKEMSMEDNTKNIPNIYNKCSYLPFIRDIVRILIGFL